MRQREGANKPQGSGRNDLRFVTGTENRRCRERGGTIGELLRGRKRGDAEDREKQPVMCYRDGVEELQGMSRDDSEVIERKEFLMKRSPRKVNLERLSAEGEARGAAGSQCHVRPNLSIRR